MYDLKVQGKQLQSKKAVLTGEEILELAGLIPPEDYELLLKVARKEFEPIQLDESVDFSKPGIEVLRIRRRIEIPYLIDDEYFSTYECFITPAQILAENGYAQGQFYLKEIQGHTEIQLQK